MEATNSIYKDWKDFIQDIKNRLSEGEEIPCITIDTVLPMLEAAKEEVDILELRIELRDDEIESLTQETIPCRDVRIGDLEDEVDYLITELQSTRDSLDAYITAYQVLRDNVERYGLSHLLDEETLLDKN